MPSGVYRGCIVPMCGAERVVAFGWCNAHYRRYRKHGVLYSPRALTPKRTPSEQAREWRLRNPERFKAANREHYRRNRAERLAYAKRRRDADLEGARRREAEIRARRAVQHRAEARARERKIGKLSAESRRFDSILRRDPCSYCGAGATEVDHIVPVVAGGKNHWENLTASCKPCNRGKWDKPLLAYLLERER